MTSERLLTEEQSYQLDIDPGYQPMVDYLNGQRMWIEYLETKRKPQCVLVDLDLEKSFDFNPQSWRAGGVQPSGYASLPEEINGLVIRSGYQVLDRVDQAIERHLLHLDPEAPVYVFEEKGLDFRKDINQKKEMRNEILGKWGLVERSILIRPSNRGSKAEVNDYLVWRARMAKEWQPMEPVNFFDGGPNWRQKWLRSILSQRVKEYEERGLNVVSYQEIVDRLRSTTFPLDDLGRLRQGFGFRLESICGCYWRVDLQGSWSRAPCKDPECDGMPVLPEKRIKESQGDRGVNFMTAEEVIQSRAVALPYRTEKEPGETIENGNRSYQVRQGIDPSSGKERLFKVKID
jgi:hypothetical protein